MHIPTLAGLLSVDTLNDSNRIRTYIHLVRKRKLNHLAEGQFCQKAKASFSKDQFMPVWLNG